MNKEEKMKLRTVFFLLVIFFIFSFSLSYAESGKQQVQPVNEGRNLVYPLSGPDDIIGSWSFVYFKKYRSLAGKNPPPPKFDLIEFGKPDVIRLISKIYGTDSTGKYKVSGDVISFSLDLPGNENSMAYNFRCSLANTGKAMILESGGIEIVYFRSYRMLEKDIAGKWISENKGTKKYMVLKMDGSCEIDSGKATGYYRIWPSRHGNAITASLREPGFGYIISIWKYEKNGEKLILTAIDKNGKLTKPAIVWKKETLKP